MVSNLGLSDVEGVAMTQKDVDYEKRMHELLEQSSTFEKWIFLAYLLYVHSQYWEWYLMRAWVSWMWKIWPPAGIRRAKL